MLDSLDELDTFLKETSTAVKTYLLTQEKKSTSELTESLSRQDSSSDVDLEQFSEEIRDMMRMILTPFSELKNRKLGKANGIEHKITSAEGPKPFRSQLCRMRS